MHRLFKSDLFNFEALRVLSYAPREGAEVAEFFDIVGKIRDNDTESWYAAWFEAANKAEALAIEAEQAGNRTAARSAYFRASHYFRSAQFMLDGLSGTDPRIMPASESHISNFWRGASLLDASVTRLDIPYEGGVKLPGYLYLPDEKHRRPGKLPLLVQTVGGDATQEEVFFILPVVALELGYAVLSFEGPGQGIVIRRNKLPIRPDWEVVVSKVMDFTHQYAAEHPEVDLDLERVALTGCSFGGYLALRGALDPRITACISIDPFYCMFDLLRSRMPPFVTNTFIAGGFLPDSGWDHVLDIAGWMDPMTRWEFKFARWLLGVPTGFQMLKRMLDFSLATPDGSKLLHKIRCPTMVTGARFSLYASPEIGAQQIFQELVNVPGDKKELWVAEDAAEGGLQAKVGAFGVLSTKTFAWLDQVFGIDRKAVWGNDSVVL